MIKSILALTLAGYVAAQSLTVDPATRTYRDEFGRTRIFHGTNVVVKGHPYIPVQDHFDPHLSLSDKDLQDMVDWGITLVRLGVMWESVEVAPQQYNMTYLAEVDKLITKMGQKGIFTMVDAHQDLYSRNTCGEGVPAFYAVDVSHTCDVSIPGYIFKVFGQCQSMEEYGHRKDEKGWPDLDDCKKTIFTKYYTSPEVCSSFEGLYKNKQGVQDRFTEYWGVVSKALSPNPYVIGYDPFNEPWPGNFYEDFSLFYRQTKFDEEYLFPMLQRVHKSIRANDDKNIYFFEAAQFPDTFPMFGGIVASVGFEQTPGGQEYLNRESLNDHTYCCQVAPEMCLAGEPPLDQKDTCKAFHAHKVQKRADDAKRLGVPLIWSEFGACSNTESCFHEITGAAEEFDKHLHSWAYWMFKGFGDFTTTGSLTEGMYDQDGNLQMYKVLALQRSYLHAVQGTPLEMRFYTDAQNNATFTASYVLNTSIKAPTEIFFNQGVYYPQGYKLSVLIDGVPSTTLEVNYSQKNYIKLLEQNPEYNGKTVTIALTSNSTYIQIVKKDTSIDFKIEVKEHSNSNSQGLNYFKINLDRSFPNDVYLKFQDGNREKICQFTQVYENECFAVNSKSHNAILLILKPGWFYDTVLGQVELFRLNSHSVTIDVVHVNQ